MGRFPAPLKTNLHTHIFCKDDSKQAVNAALHGQVFKLKRIKYHNYDAEIFDKIYL